MLSLARATRSDQIGLMHPRSEQPAPRVWVKLPQESYSLFADGYPNAKESISFQTLRSPGISLRDAIEGNCPTEWTTESVDVLSPTSPRIVCRLKIPGYEGFGCAIDLGDDNKAGQATKQRLAYGLAKAVLNFVYRFQSQQTGLQLTAEDLIIAELHQVSKADWQPVLYMKQKNPT